jgi:hypothetical protein
MKPIVDGLETEYRGSVEFKQINASTYEGLEVFNSYALFGHPSYLILDETGEILWQSVGEQSVENIESALQTALENFRVTIGELDSGRRKSTDLLKQPSN